MTSRSPVDEDKELAVILEKAISVTSYRTFEDISIERLKQVFQLASLKIAPETTSRNRPYPSHSGRRTKVVLNHEDALLKRVLIADWIRACDSRPKALNMELGKLVGLVTVVARLSERKQLKAFDSPASIRRSPDAIVSPEGKILALTPSFEKQMLIDNCRWRRSKVPPIIQQCIHGEISLGRHSGTVYAGYNKGSKVGLWMLRHPKLKLLTKRQIQILWRAAEGKTDEAIARELDIKLSTVSNHLRDIEQRLDIKGRPALVTAWANATLRNS